MTTREQLAQLAAREFELEQMRAGVEAEAMARAAALSDSLIDGSPAESETQDLRMWEQRLGDLDRAVSVMRARRNGLLESLAAERLAAREAEIARRSAEIADLDSRTLKALSKVAELQDIPEAELPRLAEIVSPRSTRMRAELAGLQMQGLAEAPIEVGSIDLDDQVDQQDLEQAVLLGETMAPSLRDLRSWLYQIEVAAVAECGVSLGSHPRRYVVHWRGGVIDAEKSYVFCGALARELAPIYGSESPGYDVASATFRVGKG